MTFNVKTLAAVLGSLATVLVLWMSCGKDEPVGKSPATPAPAPVAQTPQPQTPAPGPAPVTPTVTLSAAYTLNCKSCHGASGEGPTVLKGTKLGVTAYETAVRYGRTGMPSFAESVISNADLAADFNALKAP